MLAQPVVGSVCGGISLWWVQPMVGISPWLGSTQGSPLLAHLGRGARQLPVAFTGSCSPMGLLLKTREVRVDAIRRFQMPGWC